MFLLSLVVNDESEHDELTSYIHAFNKHVKGDERVDMSLLAIAVLLCKINNKKDIYLN